VNCAIESYTPTRSSQMSRKRTGSTPLSTLLSREVHGMIRNGPPLSISRQLPSTTSSCLSIGVRKMPLAPSNIPVLM